MSSARSVASARAKRAGINDMMKPTNSSNQTNPSVISNQNSGDKLSISHAITLITLRLGKLETYIQKLETEILPIMFNNPSIESSFTNEKSSNISLQPLEEKMNLIINRMTLLEKENVLLQNKIQILELQKNTSVNKEEILREIQKNISVNKEEILREVRTNTSVNKEEILREVKQYSTSTNREEIVTELKRHILPFENEVTKLKDLVIYLQHNSLEINQKLINVLFNNCNIEDIEDNEDIEVIEDIVQENVEDNTEDNIEEKEEDNTEEKEEDNTEKKVEDNTEEKVEDNTEENVEDNTEENILV